MQSLNIKKEDKILLLAPHQDDESIGCGGLLLNYQKQIDVILLTDGSKGGINQSEEEIIKIREDEFQKAMDFIGVNSFKTLKIKDGTLKNNYKIFKQIDFSKYSHIFIPNRNEFQKDHKAVFPFVLKSKIKKDTIICEYEVWTPLLRPNYYIDLSLDYEKKEKLISFYVSQLKFNDYISRTKGLNHYRGITTNTRYCECYQLEYFNKLQAQNSFFKNIFYITKDIDNKINILLCGFKIKV